MTNIEKPTQNLEASKIEGYDTLATLALDLRWSWSHAADALWQELDSALWAQTHNPWLVLQTLSGERLQACLTSPGFKKMLDALNREKNEADSAAAWYQQKHESAPLHTVAYFSMEFMLSESLPIYVGGLGNVAGDQLKSASDLGVPVVGIGLLYQQGYFRQSIDENGEQQAYYPYNDPGQLPIKPLRLPNGEWLRIQISLRGYPVWLRAWQVRVGRVNLYLLDTNDAANLPVHREITSEIYGGDSDMRIRQEIVLGIGGWKLLTALGLRPEVCHLNEGHAAFAVLERARGFMVDNGTNFAEALATTRAGNLFTSHTAVAAGFDHFDPGLMAYYFSKYAEQELHISLHDLMALGRENAGNDGEHFNMAYLAIRGSGGVNGVSALHGRVSRHLFEPLFSRWPTEEVPVGHVTNGIHTPGWDGEPADQVWTEACGENRWMFETEGLGPKIMGVSNERLWRMRTEARASLIDYIRESVAAQRAAEGADQAWIDNARTIFDPNILTIGFARRFVPYKRPDLLLHDQDRLVRLLTNRDHPLQLVVAGKAPPSDKGGKDLIKQWIQFIKRTNTSAHVIFLSDYDMLLAEHLVEGMDVWLNTPQRPWEASGTSGMKVLVNGGVNLSELDGWWAEAYTPEVGWALGDGQEHGADPAWDAHEAEQLYQILEQEVIPSFYTRDAGGIPTAWVERVRKSMATLTPFFSANRTVREYTEQYYLPAADAYRKRSSDKGAIGKQMVEWKHSLDKDWSSVHFGAVTIHEQDGQHVFQVQVSPGSLDPKNIRVELFAQQAHGEPPFTQEMTAISGVYTTMVPATRPAAEYTIRAVPYHEGVRIPLEEGRVLWQR